MVVIRNYFVSLPDYCLTNLTFTQNAKNEN